MKVHGGCHCGAITYEAEVDPNKVGLCYCRDCQGMSGGTCHVNAFVAEEDFHLQTGSASNYVRPGNSGTSRAQAFCGNCGTHLWARNADGTGSYGVRVPTMDRAADLPPKGLYFTRSRPEWLDREAELPHHETQ